MPRSHSREAFSMSFLDTPQILLVGRDGNGKTSTKRSIENVYQEIQVIECSGVGEPEQDRVVDTETVWNNLRLILKNCDNRGGLKAIVFVMKYGVIFTKQEKDAVNDVKEMLGEDVFRKHGIILMTYGDLFTNDNDDNTNDNFMRWCRQQTGDIKKVFEDVEHRIVLFNNRTNNHDEKKAQVEELKSLIAKVDRSYGLIDFIQAPNYIKFNPLSRPTSGEAFSLKPFHWCTILLVAFIIAFVISFYIGDTWLMVCSFMGIILLVIIMVFVLKPPSIANVAVTPSRYSSFDYTRVPMKM